MNKPSIITFSRRTDPAFYMDWFMDCVKAGGCSVPNPFSGKPYFVSLAPEDVLLINFWTKNPGATLRAVEPLLSQSYKIAYFISLTGYPSRIETAVPPVAVTSGAIKILRGLLGREALWWRYDPVIITEKHGAGWHIENFKRLCAEVWADNTERVIISLAHIDGPYSSIRGLLSDALNENGDRLVMPDYNRFIDLAAELTGIAGEYNISLEVCCSPMIKEEDSSTVVQGACLSEKHLRKIIPDMPSLKVRGTRKKSVNHNYGECRCLESRDIGTAGKCTNGCVYCYANRLGRKSKIVV